MPASCASGSWPKTSARSSGSPTRPRRRSSTSAPPTRRSGAAACESLYESPRQWIDAIHPDDRERVVDGGGERAGERPIRRGVPDRPAGRLDPLDSRPRLSGVSQRHRGLPDHRHRRRHHREKARRAGDARERAPAQRHAGQRRDGLDDARPLGPHHVQQRLPAAPHRMATRGRHRQGLDGALHPARDRAGWRLREPARQRSEVPGTTRTRSSPAPASGD